MVNRGKDNWNKAMLINRQGRSAKSKRKPSSPTLERDGINEGEWICEKDLRNMPHNHSVKEHKNIHDIAFRMPQQNFDEMASAKSKQMRTGSSLPNRSKRLTNGITNGKKMDSSGSLLNRPKTPLEAFDVKAFFEENLYDIIDLEENRSGIKEFEDAVKKDE